MEVLNCNITKGGGNAFSGILREFRKMHALNSDSHSLIG